MDYLKYNGIHHQFPLDYIKLHFLFSRGMLFHLPCSVGSLWFVVRNLHRVKKSFSSKISKYC